MPRAKQRTPALKRRIVDAAIDVLAKDGIAAVTTRRVAELAETSPPAIYELFDRKGGLVRELFFEGFRRLLRQFDALPITDDPLCDLRAALLAIRGFARDNPDLFAVMYDRPFDQLATARDERALGAGTRQFLVGRTQRCIDARALAGDATDLAHVLLAAAIGLATQERAGWLGSSRTSRDRRWTLALDRMVPQRTTRRA